MRETFSSIDVRIPGVDVEEELGRGGYSVVFRARRQGGMPCAVKVPLVRGRWTRWVYCEAVALARVRHPGLPAIYEVGEANDLPFVVMELVEGVRLADRLAQGPMSTAEAIDLATELAETLGAVHDVGLVHRDVTPRNVILGRRVRLVDFGFAAPIERVADANYVAGTLAYAAPEQLRAPSQITGRADLFALGRVLAESLTCSLGEHAGPREGPLATVLDGLLADEPSQRYPDARALLEDLARVRAAEPALGPRGYAAASPGTAIVGCEREQRQIADAWRRVGEAGGVVALVVAPRGGGKTAFVRACLRGARVATPSRVIYARCRDGDPPLALLRRVLEEYTARPAHDEDWGAHEVALRAAVGGDLAPFARLIYPGVARILGKGDAADEPRGGFAEGAAELFVRLARGVGRLFVAVDDAQWLDPISREVLRRLASRAAGAPLMLVFASRPEDAMRRAPEVLGGVRDLLRIDLPALGEVETAALIGAYLGEPPRHDVGSRVCALADGTPLGVLEVLGAMLDVGALRPRDGAWLLDVTRAKRVALPDGALAFMGRRIAELPPATRTVLEVAALSGASFDDAVVAGAVGVAPDDVGYAMGDALRAGLVEVAEVGGHRFVHDSIREMLTGALVGDRARRVHQRLAEQLDRPGDAETLYACARHYGEGDLASTPRAALRSARAAADAALRVFDNETALGFLDLARRAAAVADVALDAAFHKAVGEANLRLGALDAGRRAFEDALACAADRRTRATLHSRLAWLEEARADFGGAWDALERAFAEFGERMPKEDARSAGATIGHLARSYIRLRTPPTSGEHLEFLSDLHHLNARLGFAGGKPLRFVQSTLAGLDASRPLGPSRALATSRALLGLLLTVMGRRRAAIVELEAAVRIATSIGDSTTLAYAVQMRALTACVAGDFDDALSTLRTTLDVHGPWLQLSEYAHNAGNASFIDVLRGRPLAAWAWVARAFERKRRERRDVELHAYLVMRAHALARSLGPSADRDRWLTGEPPQVPERAFERVLCWGPRALAAYEAGDHGDRFERMISEFAAEKHDPRRSHPVLIEYYAAVAHARVHQYLSAPAPDRPARAEACAAAAHELTLAAKVPLYRAHAAFAEGAAQLFAGRERGADQPWAEAERLAAAETCPWVLFALARVRAHRLRERGRVDAAREQARIAELLARQNGALNRAGWVRDEFDLETEGAAPSVQTVQIRSFAAARRQLGELLRLVAAHGAELQPDQRASAIMDDLLRAVEADAGIGWLQPDLAGPRLLVARARGGAEPSEVDPRRMDLLHEARRRGYALGAAAGAPPRRAGGLDPARVLAVPLLLHEEAVGALLLERADASPPFTQEDSDLAVILSYQVPISIEISRLLAEREQLEVSLQRAQKMDAVGQLASGIAHDFNNMLIAVRASVNAIGAREGLDAEITSELDVIAEATERAGRLMRQLLGFSRPASPQTTRVSVNELVVALRPMLQRLLGDHCSHELHLDREVSTIHVDRGAFEQAIVNLVVNARDAVGERLATVTITTRATTLDASAVLRGAPHAGAYVALSVADTGCGIRREDLGRIFDPFFTTKPHGAGTGIGLTTVYAFVRQAGGFVEVESEVDRGTTFTLLFPAVDDEAPA